ncbi:MAG: SBBP repeat-containing protein [Anaerolineae bacterium]
MKARLFTAFVVVLGLVLLVPGGAQPLAAQAQLGAPAAPPLAPDHARVSAALRSAPLMFIENVGQFHERARFQVYGDNATLYLADDGLWVTVAEGLNLKLSFVGANPHPRLEPFNRLDTHVSYFVGSDPANWRADVPVWGGLRYVDLYPGMDLEVTGDGGRWAWQLACRSNCQFDLQKVALRVEGVEALGLDGDALHLTTALGEYTLPLLQVVGVADANLVSPTITGDQVAWPFASPIPNPQPAVANLQSDASDLLYSTFLGGSGDDWSGDIAVDGAGSAYVTGVTLSYEFPTTVGAFDTSLDGPPDVFVVKLNAAGTGLAYATFLGGSNRDGGHAIALDGAGSVYVTGYTFSSDFPTTAGAFDTSYNGYGDAFVVKLNAAGTGLAYATFLGGGSDYDEGYAIALDEAGSVYVAGYTRSPDFPTTAGAFDTSHNGSMDTFVVKVNAADMGLAYATLLGGSGDEWSGDIAVDGAGSAYVAGGTFSSDFPTTAGAFDPSYNVSDAFVVKVNADGTGLAYATFLGGSDHWDYGTGIAVDGVGNAYVTGHTQASDFPTTAGAFDTSYNGSDASGADAFVVKVNAGGTGLAYATFLGGTDWDYGDGIGVDGAGSAYVTGRTYSSDFPTTAGASDTSLGGDRDAFVVKVNADGTGLAYATFLGGSDYDGGNAITADGAGSAYVAGITLSSDFPTTAGAFDTSYDRHWDAFVAKIGPGEVTPTPTPTPGPPPALVNGGFEEGFYLLNGQSIANGWAAYTVSGQPTFAGERFTVHSGKWAYKISGYAPFTAGLAQMVQVQPGTTYRVTAYYQLYPPGDGQALLGVQDGTSAAQWVGGGWPGVWQSLSQEITVTSDRLIVTVQGRNGPDPNTNVYFDDVTVVAVGSP